MDFSKEAGLIKHINEEKKEYLKEVFSQTNIPTDIFSRIEKVEWMINKQMETLINNESVDYKNLSIFINTLIMEKVYFNKILSSTNYLKWRFEVIKANTKLKAISDSYDDGVIWLKWTTTDHVVIKMEQINAYYNIVQDILSKVKLTKDTIDTTIIALQSQLKNVTFEYLNSWKISW